MNSFYNIAQKQSINPFDGVNFIRMATCVNNSSADYFLKTLSKADKVYTRKIEGTWQILYGIQALDLTVMLQWYGADRGKLSYTKTKNNYTHKISIHFSLKDDVMTCW